MTQDDPAPPPAPSEPAKSAPPKEDKAQDLGPRVEGPSLVAWRDLRNYLGSQDTRDELVRFYCAVTGYRPLDQWIDAHLANERFEERDDKVNKLALGGFGAGKTSWEIAEMMMCIIGNPGGWFLIGAPTDDQCMGVLKPPYHAACAKMASRGYPIERRWHDTKKTSYLICEGVTRLRTYSKCTNLMGFEFTAVCADEIDTINNSAKVWADLSSRCRRPGANFRQVFGATTPDGLAATVAGTFQAARTKASGLPPEEKRRQLLKWFWAHGTGRGNPHNPPGYLEGMRDSMSKREWAQRVEGQILRPETVVWPEFDRGLHTRPWTYDGGMGYSLCYDAGDQFPHVLWVQHTPWGEDIVFDELCPDQMPVDRLHAEIVRRCRALRREPTNAVCDRAVKREISWMCNAFPQTFVQRMVTKQQQSVAEGIEVVRARLDPLEGPPKLYIAERLARDPGRRGIVKCLENYRYKRRADGSLMPEPYKDNVHDHGCDALRMGMVALHARDSRVRSLTRRMT